MTIESLIQICRTFPGTPEEQNIRSQLENLPHFVHITQPSVLLDQINNIRQQILRLSPTSSLGNNLRLLLEKEEQLFQNSEELRNTPSSHRSYRELLKIFVKHNIVPTQITTSAQTTTSQNPSSEAITPPRTESPIPEIVHEIRLPSCPLNDQIDNQAPISQHPSTMTPECLESPRHPFLSENYQIVSSHPYLQEETSEIQQAITWLAETPTVKPFFLFFKEQAPALSEGAISFILRKRLHKHPFIKDIIIIDRFENLEIEWSKLQNDSVISKSFIFRFLTFGLLEGNHFCHVYLFKKENEPIHGFCTDSYIIHKIEQKEDLFWEHVLIESIQSLFYGTFPSGILHFLETPRQADDFSCSIFAMKDAIFCTEQRENVFKGLQEEIRQKPWRRERPFFVTRCAPQLMKSTQFHTITQEFLENSRFDDPSVRQLVVTLHKYRYPWSPSKPDSFANARNLHFFCKYVREIITEHVPIPQNPLLIERIKDMVTADQEARMAAISHNHNAALWERVRQIDANHLPILRNIIDIFGWPGYQLVGRISSKHMWLLVQHCDQDVEFQKLCLPLLQRAVASQDANKDDLALLEDRVFVNTGQTQKYGSQIFSGPDNTLICRAPIEDPERVDSFRAEMELIPLEDYVIEVIQSYQIKKPQLPPELLFLLAKGKGKKLLEYITPPH